MSYKRGDEVWGHLKPAWRGRADCIFRLALPDLDGLGQWEQMWGKRTFAGTVVVCCIPFFTLDVALGDEIEIDDQYNFLRVVRESGRHTFRVWNNERSPHTVDVGLQSELLQAVERMNQTFECYSHDLFAVSVEGVQPVREFADILESFRRRNLLEFDVCRWPSAHLTYDVLPPPPVVSDMPTFSSDLHSVCNFDEEFDYIVRHPSPAWGDKCDMRFYVYLGKRGKQNGWEELHAKRIGPRTARVCCVPFEASDVQLGEDVEIGEDNVLVGSSAYSQNYSYKAFDPVKPKETFDRLLKEMEPYAPTIEWGTDHMISLSVFQSDAGEVQAVLERYEGANILSYGTGESVPPDRSFAGPLADMA